ncbi:MAG: fumarylacetoacetate hydrolase family protein [Bacteroidota bacterium]|nr:fumarylacetoacetate hydrolase family protein [Bacteroidota bacterium]MDX5429053.1 fumarylacetoacetate hydrolase family protein [Bacteroidota bacterium]
MKIICIGRNYSDHVSELRNERPTEPVVFLKPETAIVLKRHPFFIPDFSQEVHHELELVVKIDRLGKNIQSKFAHKYYHEVTLGIDFTARDLQAKLKEKGLPWEKAKAFDGSAAVGRFIYLKDLEKDPQELEMELRVNGDIRQKGNTSAMMWKIDELISYISQFFTLKKGDLIFTGTPSGVGRVDREDELELFLEGRSVLKLNVK